MRELINRQRDAFALIASANRANTSLAIFVHGFRGNYLSTWGRLPDLLRTHADTDAVFAPWDFLFLGYDTAAIRTYLDISARICTEWDKAAAGQRPFARAYDRLALFGHSLGTLGIRQLLCAWSEQPANMHGAIHSATLFGTPLNGSPWARLALGYPIAEALKRNNPQLRMLKTWIECAHSVRPWPQVRVVLGQDDKVVGADYAQLVEWAGDADPPLQTVLDHSELVKPDSWNQSDIVGFVSRGLQ